MADITKAARDIITGMPRPDEEEAVEKEISEEGLNVASEEMMEAIRANDVEMFKTALRSFLEQL
jgi:tRNA threonylcarbamoyladenosine modification (KEOPS) complex  Pcc1 subunit